jgi:SAM-dependent methyltransferase
MGMEPDVVFSRRNMLDRAAEAWRPPLFSQADSLAGRLTASCRRFVDLQAGSIWRDLVRILPQARGAVLDVGCGAQPYRSLFKSATSYLGIDSLKAKAHFGYETPDTRYFDGDVWPVQDGSVDFVLCTETMEHVQEPHKFLKEACRCLAPGGTLLLTVPFAARWHFIPFDYWRFTPSCLERLLCAAGLSGARVYARGNAVTVACYKAMALILRVALPQGKPILVALALRLVSLPFLPLLLALAVVANLSLLGQGGDDCLGYTVISVKSRT